MDIIQHLVWMRVIYMLIAALVLWLFRTAEPKPGNNYPEKRWRFIFAFRTVQWLMLIGYVILLIENPIWCRVQPSFGVVMVIIAEDLLNLLLIIGLVIFYLWLSYRCDYKGRFEKFGSYLLQYGFSWLFVVNILIFMRIDYFYLPLLPNILSFEYRWRIELIVLAFMLLIQAVILGVRRIKMSDASPELFNLVHDVASRFKIKIRSVRVWHSEGVANAFATGLFFRHILVTDSLLETTNPGDLRMIIGHECAHFKRHHLEIRLFVLALLSYLASMMIENKLFHWPFFLCFGLVAYICYMAIARAQEFDADHQAARVLGGPKRMIGALHRIHGYNLSPSRFGILGWLVSHPDLGSRVAHLESFQKNQSRHQNQSLSC